MARLFVAQYFMPTILIIDDEEDLRNLISAKFQAEGFDTILAADGLEGFEKARKEKPELIVLDLMMPGRDGMTVCKDLRSHGKTKRIPILMLTALGDTDHKIKGLEMGADDYMSKPFSPKELVLRVKNILRRTLVVGDGGAEIELGPLFVDRNNLRVNLAGEEIDLTSTEFKLLLCLIETPGAPRERAELLEQVWGYSNLSQTRTLDTHVKRLRAKLGEYGSCIETVRSVGYRFNESALLSDDET